MRQNPYLIREQLRDNSEDSIHRSSMSAMVSWPLDFERICERFKVCSSPWFLKQRDQEDMAKPITFHGLSLFIETEINISVWQCDWPKQTIKLRESIVNSEISRHFSINIAIVFRIMIWIASFLCLSNSGSRYLHDMGWIPMVRSLEKYDRSSEKSAFLKHIVRTAMLLGFLSSSSKDSWNSLWNLLWCMVWSPIIEPRIGILRLTRLEIPR
jgi:hypothetical protein